MNANPKSDACSTCNHEEDYSRVVHEIGPTEWLPETGVEIISPVVLDRPPQHVLFDFDGTLSLIREGWPEVMIPMMVEILQATGTKEPAEELYAICSDFVTNLTGKQTIYQMIRLAEEITKRGGQPEDPAVYKQMYIDRLMVRIADRREGLRSGRIDARDMLVPYSLELLESLKQRGATLYVASGTDEPHVIEEVELLGLDKFFGRHVYGAQDDYRSFSKAQVIERILRENDLKGGLLLGFGDGYVEIRDVKRVGGTAVAVASDEAGRSGKPDPWKRDRLIGAGADLVIADYRDFDPLLDYIWGKN